jgi:hypothetical protein
VEACRRCSFSFSPPRGVAANRHQKKKKKKKKKKNLKTKKKKMPSLFKVIKKVKSSIPIDFSEQRGETSGNTF